MVLGRARRGTGGAGGAGVVRGWWGCGGGVGGDGMEGVPGGGREVGAAGIAGRVLPGGMALDERDPPIEWPCLFDEPQNGYIDDREPVG